MSDRPELEDEALGLLWRLTGDPAARFRADQLEAILALAGARGRVLLVQRTGLLETMQNSQQQYRNIVDAFDISGEVPSGPVLLVDDIVDSRWTLAVVGSLLREAGSGPVFPFALADTAGRSVR